LHLFTQIIELLYAGSGFDVEKQDIVNIVNVKSRHSAKIYAPEKPGVTKVGYPPNFGESTFWFENIFLTLLKKIMPENQLVRAILKYLQLKFRCFASNKEIRLSVYTASFSSNTLLTTASL
jgi:hypothetical protein